MIHKPDSCMACACYLKSKWIVPDKMVPDPDLIVVGEAPGTNEEEQGVPFVGKAGEWLRVNLLEPAGWNPDKVSYTNVLRCLWPDRQNPYPTGKIRQDAEKVCRQYDHWNEYYGVPIMLLGGKAIHLFLGKENVTEMHGHVEFKDNRWIGCTYHPAAIFRKPELLPLVLREFKNFKALIANPSLADVPYINKYRLPAKLEGVMDAEWNVDTRKITILGFGQGNGGEPYKIYSSFVSEFEVDMYRGEIQGGAKVIGHNIIDADLDVLGFSPLEILQLIDNDQVFDTLISAHRNHMHWAADESQKTSIPLGLYDLASLRKFYGPYRMWKGEPDPIQYNGEDVGATVVVYENERRLIEAFGQQKLFKRDMKLAALCCEMFKRGVKIDRDALIEYGNQVEARRAELKAHLEKVGPGVTKGKKVIKFIPFNPNSPVQIKKWAKEVLKVNLQTTEYEALKKYEGKNADFDLLIEYRQDVKQLKTWFPVELCGNSLIVYDDWINPRFKVTGTSMGRLSCSKPNFQNITNEGVKVFAGGITKPKPNLRRFIVPREKDMELWSFDYKQVEDWTFAFCAGDDVLLGDLLAGRDIHAITGANYFSRILQKTIAWSEVSKDQRNVGKACNHKAKYGILPATLAYEMTGKRTNEAKKMAEDLLNIYFGRYKRVREFQVEVMEQAKKNALINPFGTRVRIYAMEDHDFMKKGCHFFGSGTAADAFNDRAVAIWEELKIAMLLLVHDEMVFELPIDSFETARNIKELMEMPFRELDGMSLPVDVKRGPNYGTLEKVKL